jgi:FRG domain
VDVQQHLYYTAKYEKAVYIKAEKAADANSLLRGTAFLLPKPVSLFRIAGASLSRDDWSMICGPLYRGETVGALFDGPSSLPSLLADAWYAYSKFPKGTYSIAPHITLEPSKDAFLPGFLAIIQANATATDKSMEALLLWLNSSDINQLETLGKKFDMTITVLGSDSKRSQDRMHTVFSNIREAIDYCRATYANEDYIFRGQRKDWPLKSSLFRLDSDLERETKWKETVAFYEWMLNNSRLTSFNASQDTLALIAQHYGFPTDLIDFTTDVLIAGYFATHGEIVSGEIGVVYVLSVSHLDLLSRKMPTLVYAPVLPQMSGVWRIENQKGVLVRDVGGFISSHGDDVIIDAVRFIQRENETITTLFPRINDRFIYPPPNDFEQEIERYESIRLRSRPIESMIDPKLWAIRHIERDPTGSDVEAEAQVLDWTTDAERWAKVDPTPFERFPRIAPGGSAIKVRFTSDKAIVYESSLSFARTVHDLRTSAYGSRANVAIDVVLGDDIKGELDEARATWLIETSKVSIEEFLNICLFWPLSDDQLARAIQNLFALAFHTPDTTVDGEELATSEAFQETVVIQLEYEDQSQVVSRSFAPASYFETIASMTDLRNRFNLRYPEFQLDLNYQLFQFVTDIKKIMSLHDAIDLWAIVLIPSQLIFRTRVARVLNPYTAMKIGFA